MSKCITKSKKIEKYLQVEIRTNLETGEKTYRGRYQIPGEKYKRENKRTEWFLYEDLAIERARALKHSKENNTEVSVFVSNPVVDEFLDMRKDYVRSQGLDDVSASYKKTQFEDIENLRNYTPADILRLKVSEIKPVHIASWCNAIYKTKSKKFNKPFSYSYYKRLLFQIRSCIQYARTLQLLSYDNSILLEYTLDQFVKDNKKSKKTRSKDMSERYLTEDDFLYGFLAGSPSLSEFYLFDKMNELDVAVKYKMLFLMMFYTGMRTCEARALRWSAVRFNDVDNSTVALTKSVNLRVFKEDIKDYLKNHAVPKTNSSVRVVALEPFLVVELGLYKNYFHSLYGDDIGDMLLFPGETAKSNEPNSNYLSDNAIAKQIKKRLEKMNKNRPEAFSKHDFRRSCARNMILEHKLSYDEVYANFGHSTSKLLKEQYDTLKAEEKSQLVLSAFKDKNYFRESSRNSETLQAILSIEKNLNKKTG